MSNTNDPPTEYELIPVGPCQRDGCRLGREAAIHSGQERAYHGYQPAMRVTPEQGAAIKGLVKALGRAHHEMESVYWNLRDGRETYVQEDVIVEALDALNAARAAGLVK